MRPTTIKVLTLNCWGVFLPIVCQRRHERIQAIAEELAKGEYDIILLQEIWKQSDYAIIHAKISSALPHSHYFHSGMFGSGLCIFSKHCIMETQLFQFALNGYPTKLFHGDWFGGKAIGLAKVDVDGIYLNVYMTHLHAEYDEANDEYKAHRSAQAFQLSQVIRNTSETCDAVLLGGDLNYTPDTIGYKLVRHVGNVNDAWLSQGNAGENGEGTTCDRPDNTFTSKNTPHSKGQRLDYLCYRQNAGYNITCEKCSIAMGRVPGRDYNYSDHEGVRAVFTLKNNVTGMARVQDLKEVTKQLSDLIPMMDWGIQKSRRSRTFHGLAFVLCLVGLLITGCLPDECWWLPLQTLGVGCVRALLTLVALVSFLMCFVFCNAEMNALTSTRNDAKRLLLN